MIKATKKQNTIEQQKKDVQEQIELMQYQMYEHNAHLDYLEDLNEVVNVAYKDTVDFAIDLIIAQRNEIMEKQLELKRKYKFLSRQRNEVQE